MALPKDRRDRRVVVRGSDEALVWGKFVKSWATGRNYVDNPQFPIPPVEDPPKYPRPNTIRDLVGQLGTKLTLYYDDAAGSPVEANDNIGLSCLEGNADVLVVRLPAAEFIEKSEAELSKPTGVYSVAAYYVDVFYDSRLLTAAVDTEEHRLELHAKRLGEYTINQCM